jgi:hypothetical protein
VKAAFERKHLAINIRPQPRDDSSKNSTLMARCKEQ